LSGCSFVHDKEINSGADGVITGSKGYVNKPVHFLSSDVGVFLTYTIKCWDQNKKIDQCPDAIMFSNNLWGWGECGVDGRTNGTAQNKSQVHIWHHYVLLHFIYMVVVNLASLQRIMYIM